MGTKSLINGHIKTQFKGQRKPNLRSTPRSPWIPIPSRGAPAEPTLEPLDPSPTGEPWMFPDPQGSGAELGCSRGAGIYLEREQSALWMKEHVTTRKGTRSAALQLSWGKIFLFPFFKIPFSMLHLYAKPLSGGKNLLCSSIDNEGQSYKYLTVFRSFTSSWFSFYRAWIFCWQPHPSLLSLENRAALADRNVFN